MTFEDLGLSQPLVSILEEQGYKEPTPIQKKVIPLALMGQDVVGCAQTGTGKSASFILPLLDILSQSRSRSRMARCIILQPTRELACQISKNFLTYGRDFNLTQALLIGGESFVDQQKILGKGADILICTPGRMIDQFQRGKLILSDVQMLIIDEADRMLDMGFIPDIQTITNLLPKKRQTLMFSATMSDDIQKLSQQFLNDPKHIHINAPSSMAKTIEHYLCLCSGAEKKQVLKNLIQQENITNAFVFCNRKKDVDQLTSFLKKSHIQAEAFHGDMPQQMRNKTLEQFKEGKMTCLVCSDVAARGIHVSDISHVFNFELPTQPEDYVHRTGRTGRAGQKGKAFTLVSPENEKKIKPLEKLIGSKIPVIKFGQESDEKQPQVNEKKKAPTSKKKENQTKKSLKPKENPKAKENVKAKEGSRKSNESLLGFGSNPVPQFFLNEYSEKKSKTSSS